VVQDGKEAILHDGDGKGKIQRRRSDVIQRCNETSIRREDAKAVVSRVRDEKMSHDVHGESRWMAEESFRKVEVSEDPESDIDVEDGVLGVVREVDDVT
jgi:hypothetical protein